MGMVDSLKLAPYISDWVTSHNHAETAAKAKALETDMITRVSEGDKSSVAHSL